MEASPEDRGTGRKLDLGILLFLGCLLLIPCLLWYLLADWEGGSTGTREPVRTDRLEAPETPGEPSLRSEARRIARENGERNARDYRRRLSRELEEARVALQQARNQARLDPQPEMSAHWRAIIDEKSGAVQTAVQRLSDFEALLK